MKTAPAMKIVEVEAEAVSTQLSRTDQSNTKNASTNRSTAKNTKNSTTKNNTNEVASIEIAVARTSTKRTSSEILRLEETVVVEVVTAVPPVLTRHLKVTAAETIPLSKMYFWMKTDGTARSGIDLFGRHRVATRAKSPATCQMLHFLLNLNLKVIGEQIALSLRDSSTHHQVRKCFKAAGVIDAKELATTRHVANQTKRWFRNPLKLAMLMAESQIHSAALQELLLLLLQKHYQLFQK